MPEIKSPTCLTFGGEDYRLLLITSYSKQETDINKLDKPNGNASIIKFDKEENIAGIKP